MKIITFIIFSIFILIYSCSNDSSVNPLNQNQQTNYTKVLTAETGQTKFELYNATASYIAYGYNDLGFKVFLNNQEQTAGWVKFKPKMYHNFPGSAYHTSPTSGQFLYNGGKSMFSGYACFTMVTDTSMGWWGFFNYNNQANIDSVYFTVNAFSNAQVRTFTSINSTGIFQITLVSPYDPKVGMNTFKCLLHKTITETEYEEVTNADMFIRPWMEAMGHGSSNNVNPYNNNGFYEGQVNFTMSGTWSVYDSVKVSGEWVTPTPPPKFTMNVQ